MKKKINAFLSLIAIVMLLPLVVTVIWQHMRLENLIASFLSEETLVEVGATENKEAVTDGAQDGTKLATEEAERRVLGIVAKEIGVGADKEAILAQCVIARTNLYDAVRAGTAEPEALSIEEMQKLWGEDFDEIYSVLQGYVSLTEGQVLTYNGSYIYAAYHAISAGMTRNISELYEGTQMPYLQACLCQEDTTAEGYLSILYWEEEEFLEECQSLFPEAQLQDAGQIAVESRDSAGYALRVSVGEESYAGEEFRDRLGLNSACFALTEMEGKVRIVTKGLGHGFGLSQHGAASMAADGKGYGEILAYFYPGAELGTIDGL